MQISMNNLLQCISLYYQVLTLLDQWLRCYPQDFVRDATAEKGTQSLVNLLGEMKLKDHPTTINLQTTFRKIKSGIVVQGLTKRGFSVKRLVNRTTSSPPQLQEMHSPARLCRDERLRGSGRSLDRISGGTPSKIPKTFLNLLSLRVVRIPKLLKAALTSIEISSSCFQKS
ncbi:hypothetical protein BSL78_21916 [Apostichopus japonicus]|uniref:Uncharacterized protein n=1 Tax=Stichopus japonicus TaxID=307972 RepID=A0A2G8JZR4_STIJA|nr:hypothetical protein BSL78_21916 [Apostichopus japonicus]